MFRNALPKLLIMFALTLPETAFSASLEELTGAGQAAALRAAGAPVTQVQTRNPAPRLVPQHGELVNFVNNIVNNLKPGLLVETLSVVEAPGSGRLDILNHLTALSTLTGIQYYSERRGDMRVLYESSRVIDNPRDKTPLPDPVFTELPAVVELYARQKDLTFGDNLYRYDYQTGGDFVFFTQENLTTMTTSIIPAVGKGRFRSVVAVIEAGDSLLIYAASMAKTVSIPGLGPRIGLSFTNRIIAILNWFNGRLRLDFPVK